MDWVDCKERSPDVEGDILVSIKGVIFRGECFYATKYNNIICLNESDDISFEMDKRPIGDIPISIAGRKWIMPKHFKEPEFWLPIPKLPKEIK